MKKLIFSLAVVTSIVLFTNCEKNDDSPTILEIDYVGFEADFTIGVDPTGNMSQEVRVATSNKASSDRSFTIAVDTDLSTADPSAYSVPSSVTVPAGSNVGTFNVDVVGPNVDPSGDDQIVLVFTSDEEGLFISDPIVLGLEQVCPYPETFLDITFDNYSEETSWILEDSSNTVLYSGSYGSGETSASTKFCLPNGTYTFTIFDFYQDGICCIYGDGSYTLTNNGTVIASGGSFGASEATEFTLSN